jgi:hypothetical protein
LYEPEYQSLRPRLLECDHTLNDSGGGEQDGGGKDYHESAPHARAGGEHPQHIDRKGNEQYVRKDAGSHLEYGTIFGNDADREKGVFPLREAFAVADEHEEVGESTGPENRNDPVKHFSSLGAGNEADDGIEDRGSGGPDKVAYVSIVANERIRKGHIPVLKQEGERIEVVEKLLPR